MSQASRPLIQLNPTSVSTGIRWPGYSLEDVTIGIAHIGVGGFHRAHQARYIDEYMAATGDTTWGICGIGLMPGDQALIERLNRQGALYSLTEKDDRGADSRIIGALRRVMFAPADRQAVIDQLADPDIHIISMTITEGGYRYDFEKQRLYTEHPDIVHDLNHPEAPRTMFGYLWQAGRRRARLGDRGRVTLLSCDNVPQNGDVLRNALLEFIDRAEPDLTPWFEEAVTFPNSMVDRITPAPSAADSDYIRREYGIDDTCALGCEPFIQWVVEDRFAAGRPRLERVGVEFTTNVTPFEKTKLRLLNGGHLMMAYIGYLAGYTRVNEAIQDPLILQLVTDYMTLDAEPTLPRIDSLPVKEYEATLIKRFSNSQISDQQVRICSDGYAKLPNYIMPIVFDRLSTKSDTRRLSFLFACFLTYLKGKADDGSALEVIEFNLPEEFSKPTATNRIDLFKTDAYFGRQPTHAQLDFLNAVEQWCQLIDESGAYDTLGLLRTN